MTDDELTPAQEAEIHRLLRGARHDEQLPDEVAARLDATLADLAGEPSDVSPSSPATSPVVVPLRRRRRATMVLAAAAVAAIGFGTTQVVSGGGGAEFATISDAGDDSMAEDAPAAGAGEAGPRDDDAGAEADEGRAEERQEAIDSRDDTTLALEELRVTALRSTSLVRDLTSALGDLAPQSGERERGYQATKKMQRLARAAREDGRCGPGAPVREGAYVVPASYDGSPALVVVTPSWAGFRLAQVYVCDGARPHRVARSVVLPPGQPGMSGP